MASKYKNKMIIYHGPYYSSFNKRYNVMSKVFDALFLYRYKKLNTTFITKSGLATDYLKKKGLENITTIGVGIDRDTLSTSDGSTIDFISALRKKDGNKIMYIGRIEPRRNVSFLLDVLHKLTEKNKDISLVLIGRGDEQYVNSFFQYAKDLNVYDRIVYRNSIEQCYMEQLYNIIDVFLLPTIYDIFGMVLLEAMYFKKCVITTVNGGSNMLIDNTKNGFLFDNFDAEKWCSQINELLSNEGIRNTIGDAAHNTIIEKFTWDVLAGKFLTVYERKILNNYSN